MSDKVFKGNRGATGVFFMTLVTIATVVYWLNPPGNPGVDMACMIIIGFLIYGPVMLIGLHALELAPKKAWTAVAMKTATHELATTVQPSAALYGLESHLQGKVVTFGGGYPLWRDGQLIAGLGISGGSIEQDMAIAQAAMAAINVRTHQ